MGTHYSQITEAYRMAVQAMVLAGFSEKSIAKQLDFQLTLNHLELNRGKADETSLARWLPVPPD